MSLLDSNITTLQDKIYGASDFDISKSFLSDDDVVKKILISKNPSMSENDVNIMVYGQSSGPSASSVSSTESPYNPTQSSPDTSGPVISSGVSSQSNLYSSTSGYSSGLNSSNLSSDEVKTTFGGRFPIPKNSPFHDQARSLKSELKSACVNLIKEEKAIIQNLILTSVKISNAIPGIVILISPLSFNVPAAISLLLLMIDAINLLINKILDVLQFLEPLKKLKLAIDDASFTIVTAPINIAITVLISIFEPISLLKKFIDLLMGQLNSSISTHASPTQSGTFSIPPTPKNGVFDESNLASALNTIDPGNIYPTLTSIKQLSDNISLGKEQYVYDVTYPDGSISTNLDELDIESIKEKYNVIFDNNNSI